MKNNNTAIIGLKELRENMDDYIAAVEKGGSFIVMRKSRPVFRVSAADDADNLWETAVDFTKIKKGGAAVDEILSRL